MDAATAERINNLAKNLKDLHLAASMEEAFSKAREIILGNQGSGKPIREMMDEDVTQAAVKQAEEIAHAKEISKNIEEVKEAQVKDELNNAEMAKEAEKAGEQLQKHQKELEKIRHEIEAAKKALDEAKNVQQKFERQTPEMEPREQQPVEKPRAQLSEEDKKKSDLSRIFNFGKR